MKRRQKGFTLIEILIVLGLVVGFVAWIGGKIFGKAERANMSTAQLQISDFEQGLQLYRQSKGKFPDQSEGLQALVKGGYLGSSELPKDPWGHDYVYRVPGPEGKAYEIVCLGKDGQEGGEEDTPEGDISSAKAK